MFRKIEWQINTQQLCTTITGGLYVNQTFFAYTAFRLGAGYSGSTRSSLWCAARMAGETAAEGRPSRKMPAGLRPGTARKLHGERHRRRGRVRPDERENEILHAITIIHLLQRARDGRNGQLRQWRGYPRRDQERRKTGGLS